MVRNHVVVGLALLAASLCGASCSSESKPEPEDSASPDETIASTRFDAMDPADAARPGRDGIAEARDVFHELLRRHDDIERTVEDLPNGVRTVTISDDPEVSALIRLHVRQMEARFGAGRPVRKWDPLFAELVERFDEIDMTSEDIDGGVRVTQTSEDPQVVLLIRQHAHRGVSEFVERGFDRASESTPMPEGYQSGG